MLPWVSWKGLERTTGHPLLFQSLSTPDQDPQRQDCKTHNKEWVFKCADYASK